MKKITEIKRAVLNLAKAANLVDLKDKLRKIGYTALECMDFRRKSSWIAVEEFLQNKLSRAAGFLKGIKDNWQKVEPRRKKEDEGFNLMYDRGMEKYAKRRRKMLKLPARLA